MADVRLSGVGVPPERVLIGGCPKEWGGMPLLWDAAPLLWECIPLFVCMCPLFLHRLRMKG